MPVAPQNARSRRHPRREDHVLEKTEIAISGTLSYYVNTISSNGRHLFSPVLPFSLRSRTAILLLVEKSLPPPWSPESSFVKQQPLAKSVHYVGIQKTFYWNLKQGLSKAVCCMNNFGQDAHLKLDRASRDHCRSWDAHTHKHYCAHTQILYMCIYTHICA